MSGYWHHDTPDAALYACWAEADDGVAHCRAMIEPHVGYGLYQGTVLDFGCGVGRVLAPLAADYPRVSWVGVDTSATMLRYAAARVGPNVELRADVPTGTPLDAAYSVVVLQHMPRADVAAALRQIAVALRPGAVFRFQFVTGGDPGPHNYPLPRADADQLLADAGFGAWAYSDDPRFPTWTWCTARRAT